MLPGVWKEWKVANMKTLLKVHRDVITVPQAIQRMMQQYADEGFEVERLSVMNFKIILSDGWVHVFWENGCIFQEIFEGS